MKPASVYCTSTAFFLFLYFHERKHIKIRTTKNILCLELSFALAKSSYLQNLTFFLNAAIFSREDAHIHVQPVHATHAHRHLQTQATRIQFPPFPGAYYFFLKKYLSDYLVLFSNSLHFLLLFTSKLLLPPSLAVFII